MALGGERLCSPPDPSWLGWGQPPASRNVPPCTMRTWLQVEGRTEAAPSGPGEARADPGPSRSPPPFDPNQLPVHNLCSVIYVLGESASRDFCSKFHEVFVFLLPSPSR
jgi:hypothetical protein